MIIRAHAASNPLKDESVQCVVTSPPFWRGRVYGTPLQRWADGWIGELGLESTVAQYVEHLVEVFREVRRVLRPDGTVWIHLEDGYAGGGIGHRDQKRWPKAGGAHYPKTGRKTDRSLKRKDLTGSAWRMALALQSDGWYLRSDVIIRKGNPFPEGARDRPFRSHGYLFLLTKSERYFYNAAAMPPEYRRDVWTLADGGHSSDPHSAVMHERLVEPAILAGSRPGDVVLDPFAGSGTTVRVADRLGRRGIGLELQPAYVEASRRRSA